MNSYLLLNTRLGVGCTEEMFDWKSTKIKAEVTSCIQNQATGRR